jgi:hypothetical protein
MYNIYIYTSDGAHAGGTIMTIIYKPGVYTWVHYIKLICRFWTKHSGTIVATLATVLSVEQLALVTAAATAIQAACDMLNVVYPNIKA